MEWRKAKVPSAKEGRQFREWLCCEVQEHHRFHHLDEGTSTQALDVPSITAQFFGEKQLRDSAYITTHFGPWSDDTGELLCLIGLGTWVMNTLSAMKPKHEKVAAKRKAPPALINNNREKNRRRS